MAAPGPIPSPAPAAVASRQALFYSHQLRAALADLARLERRGRKSEAVHRHGMRLDTRDADGIKRIIREDRPERVGGSWIAPRHCHHILCSKLCVHLGRVPDTCLLPATRDALAQSMCALMHPLRPPAPPRCGAGRTPTAFTPTRPSARPAGWSTCTPTRPTPASRRTRRPGARLRPSRRRRATLQACSPWVRANTCRRVRFSPTSMRASVHAAMSPHPALYLHCRRLVRVQV